MRWIAVFACLFMTVAVGAWEKIDQMDGGIVFSGSLTGLKRQSFSLGDEVQLPRLSGKVSCFAIQPSRFLPNQTGDVRVYQGTASGDEKVRLHLVVSSDRFFCADPIQ